MKNKQKQDSQIQIVTAWHDGYMPYMACARIHIWNMVSLQHTLYIFTYTVVCKNVGTPGQI